MVSETANIKSEPNACLWVQMNFSIELVHSFVSINRLSSIQNWFDFVFADLMAGWRIYSSMICHIFSSGDGLSSPIAKLLPEPTLSCHQNCLGCSYLYLRLPAPWASAFLATTSNVSPGFIHVYMWLGNILWSLIVHCWKIKALLLLLLTLLSMNFETKDRILKKFHLKMSSEKCRTFCQLFTWPVSIRSNDVCYKSTISTDP